MKTITKSLVLTLLTVSSFFMGTTQGLSQDKPDEKQNIKTPPKLLKLNQSQSYSLQNSTQLFKEVFDSSSETSFSVIKQEQDQLGYTHKKHQQYYKGVKVEFGTATLGSRQKVVESINLRQLCF